MIELKENTNRLKVLFLLCGDHNKASSRVRGFWIAEALNEEGVFCKLLWKDGKLDLLRIAIEIPMYDAIVFQKTYSRYHRWLMAFAQMMGKRCYMDIDDAPSKTNAPKTLRNFESMLAMSDGVFAGSQHLLNYCKKHQLKTYLIPSSIYLKNYARVEQKPESEKVCLGWIGNGAHYKEDLIEILVEPLTAVAITCPVRFKIVGACGEQELYDVFGSIEGLEVDFVDAIEWSDPDAISVAISDFDVGLYPLLPNAFNHFKCGFKALEYMAVGIPVVSSAVAINVDIVDPGENGYLVNTKQEWITALSELICNNDLRKQMGQSGRKIVEEQYNIEKNALLIKSILNYNSLDAKSKGY